MIAIEAFLLVEILLLKSSQNVMDMWTTNINGYMFHHSVKSNSKAMDDWIYRNITHNKISYTILRSCMTLNFNKYSSIIRTVIIDRTYTNIDGNKLTRKRFMWLVWYNLKYVNRISEKWVIYFCSNDILNWWDATLLYS